MNAVKLFNELDYLMLSIHLEILAMFPLTIFWKAVAIFKLSFPSLKNNVSV